MKKQRGVFAVEFALVGGVFLLLLFSVLEIGRLLFTWNVLNEASRRAARLAVVCQEGAAINTLALFNGAQIVPNLGPENLTISYLTLNGEVTTGVDIDLVRAEITNYQHQLLIPGVMMTLNSPSFATTLPRESLGVTRFGLTQCV